MKKRLRKKKHIGEFKELGFLLEAKLNLQTDEELDRFNDEFLDYIEKENMHIGGGMGMDDLSLYVCTGVVNTGNAEARENLISWMDKHENVTEVNAGELKDAYYCP
jgi:uncharacterized protein YggL (DUF469 family)